MLFSCAAAQNEIELMEAKMGDRVPIEKAHTGMCNNKPLDPYMLIDRVSNTVICFHQLDIEFFLIHMHRRSIDIK